MIPISNSEIAVADRCLRQWYLKYYLGFSPADEPPVSASKSGTRVHAALEGMYGYDLDPETVLGALYALSIDAQPDWREDLMREWELTTIMVRGYLEWVAETGIDAPLSLVSLERQVQVPFPLVPGVELRAKMDQAVYNEDTGILSFLDHKTAVNFDSHESLALNPQFKFYSVVQRLMAGTGGPVVAGGMINTLRRVKRTEKSRPPYYQRDVFRYSPEELNAAELRIAALARRMVAARQALDEAHAVSGGELMTVNAVQRSVAPPTPIVRDCKWSCPFVSLCPMMDDGSDWPGVLMRSGKYQQGNPYQYQVDDPLGAARAKLGNVGAG